MVTRSARFSENRRSAMQREALPQLSTSKPSLFQMRMRTSAVFEGSSMISWSQPIPFLRSAMALACASLDGAAVRAGVENDKVVAEPVHLAEWYGASLCHGSRLYGDFPLARPVFSTWNKAKLRRFTAIWLGSITDTHGW